MTIQMQSTCRALARMFLVMVAFFAAACSLNAQIPYPNFKGGGRVNSILTDGSPAIAGDNNYLYVAYADATNNGYLTYGYSTDGVNFTLTQTNYAMNSDPAISVASGSTGRSVYIAFVGYNNDIWIYNFSTTTALNIYQDYIPESGNVNTARPAIYTYPDPSVSYVDDVYVAWQGQSYDPSTGTYDGQWINTAIRTAFQGFATKSSVTPVGETYTAGSGPALALNGLVYLTYLDAATGYPQMFTASPGSTSFTNTSTSSGIGGNYAGDPALGTEFNTVYAGFRSAYQEDNLWMVAVTGSGYNYGCSLGYAANDPSSCPGNGEIISLTGSPSFGSFGPVGGLYSFTFFEAGRTNYPNSGPYAWIYASPSSYFNYYPNSVSGGGNGGDGGDDGDDGGDGGNGCPPGGCTQ